MPYCKFITWWKITSNVVALVYKTNWYLFPIRIKCLLLFEILLLRKRVAKMWDARDLNVVKDEMEFVLIGNLLLCLQVLELGIVSHSIIIGISLGVSHSPCTIRPLIAALSFHQFFEGFALGGCIWQAQFNTQSATLMACFFRLNNSSRDQHRYCSCFSLQPKQPRCSDCWRNLRFNISRHSGVHGFSGSNCGRFSQ